MARNTSRPRLPMTDWQGLPYRPSLGKTRRGALHKVNPPGAKLARKIMRTKALPWRGEVLHTGEITQLNLGRSIARILGYRDHSPR